MGYNRGMGIELCKFTGGTCNLCGSGDVCKRKPPVDMSVVRRFIEDHRTELPFPTCESFEGNWRTALGLVQSFIPGEHGTWDGLSRSGSLVLTAQPHVTLDPSRWFRGGCRHVQTTLLEKKPRDVHDLFAFGAQNGIAVCHGVPFAVSTRKVRRVMRPVVLSQRQQLLNQVTEFERKYGPIYNSR